MTYNFIGDYIVDKVIGNPNAQSNENTIEIPTERCIPPKKTTNC